MTRLVLAVAACLSAGAGLSVGFVHHNPEAAVWLIGLALALWLLAEKPRAHNPHENRKDPLR